MNCASCRFSSWSDNRFGLICAFPLRRPYKRCEQFQYEPGTDESERVRAVETSVRGDGLGAQDQSVAEKEKGRILEILARRNQKT